MATMLNKVSAAAAKAETCSPIEYFADMSLGINSLLRKRGEDLQDREVMVLIAAPRSEARLFQFLSG
ncbi:hypothetical protein YTPLAS18_10670 [Nitrospira sp.]|nr:hypothetical protein YTPLAS18_10670 [Nitrospira sp.]